MEAHKRRTGRMPKMLPTMHLDDGMHFIDLRLREFRLHTAPWDPVPFDSDRGRDLCDQLNIMTCPACGISVIVPGVSRQDGLRCMSCPSLLDASEQD
jgi:hypothetical protein